MKTAKVICWIRTPSDTRDTAGSTASAEIPQADALQVATSIDSIGNPVDYVNRFNLPEGHHFAAGHGVTVVYQSGYRRHVRAEG